MLRLLSLAALFVGANALELTPDNWDEKTAGKSVFIKFLAPWCGHCKSMKPAWDELMESFKDSPTSLVADVDCTAAGQPLCDKFGVQGYPSIKYGDPDDLKDYEGGRDADSLKKFAAESLGPQCGPTNLDLCDEDVKSKYEKYLAMSPDRLDSKIRVAKKTFEIEVPIMQRTLASLKAKGKDEL